jgi:hypothetical protein
MSGSRSPYITNLDLTFTQIYLNARKTLRSLGPEFMFWSLSHLLLKDYRNEGVGRHTPDFDFTFRLSFPQTNEDTETFRFNSADSDLALKLWPHYTG